MRTAISIVLNGMHHLREQAEIIPKIFDKWIIVEGATKNVKCSNWCQEMPEDFHDENGNSIDGTKEFLEELSSEFDNVDVYLASGLWEGKVSMFNHGLTNSNPSDGFLWEIDIDEYWDENKINNTEKIISNTGADCASFLCDYLLSEDIIVRGDWGEGKSGGYKRCWKYKTNSKFKTHIPPVLEGESKCLNWIVTPRFTHLSYYFEDQVKFKSKFYTDHENIYEGWKNITTGKTPLPCGVDKLFLKPVAEHWKNTIITYR
jgi:hypothetical protein